jgi:hypothetical protein
MTDDNTRRRGDVGGGLDLTGTNQRAEMVEILRNLTVAIANMKSTILGLLIAQTGVFITLLGIVVILWTR